MEIYGIIPARYKSSRLEAKPLALIHGKPMFWHVYERAKKAKLKALFLATDDERIARVAQEYNVPYVMTSPEHNSGSDRVLEAAQKLHLPENSIIVNIQGDEPLLAPEMLNALIEPFFENSEIQVSTLADIRDKNKDKDSFLSPNTVKVVFSNDKKALYFSRAPLPYTREFEEEGTSTIFYSHIGLYAFRYTSLKLFTELPVSSLEKLEKLEQLRLLENNIPIHVVANDFSSNGMTTIGVDTLEDLEKVRQMMA